MFACEIISCPKSLEKLITAETIKQQYTGMGEERKTLLQVFGYHNSQMEKMIGIDGEHWLFTQRHKTGEKVRVPLLPKALEILNKYKNHPACLNQDRLLPKLKKKYEIFESDHLPYNLNIIGIYVT